MFDELSKIIAAIGDKWFRAFVFVMGCLWIWHTFFGSVAELGTAQNSVAQGANAEVREAAIAKIQEETARYAAEKAKADAGQAKAQACISALQASVKTASVDDIQAHRIPYVPECPISAANQPPTAAAVAQAPTATPARSPNACKVEFATLLNTYFPPDGMNVSTELFGAVDEFKKHCTYMQFMDDMLKKEAGVVLDRIEAAKAAGAGPKCAAKLDAVVADISNGGTIPAMQASLLRYNNECPPMSDSERLGFINRLNDAVAIAERRRAGVPTAAVKK